LFGSLPVLVQPLLHWVAPVGHPASPPLPESPASWWTDPSPPLLEEEAEESSSEPSPIDPSGPPLAVTLFPLAQAAATTTNAPTHATLASHRVIAHQLPWLPWLPCDP
jgi:hypothetical protein